MGLYYVTLSRLQVKRLRSLKQVITIHHCLASGRKVNSMKKICRGGFIQYKTNGISYNNLTNKLTTGGNITISGTNEIFSLGNLILVE
jgi:hypothetical protein